MPSPMVRRWMMATMFREGDGPWQPGASVSTASAEIPRESVAWDFLRWQKWKHPHREFAPTVYITDLDEHLAGRDNAELLTKGT